MSPTIRVPKRNRDRVVRLAKNTGKQKVRAYRHAPAATEHETDNYRGDIESIARAPKFARPSGRDVSSNVDKYLVGPARRNQRRII